jgi:hypothetical protein
VDKNTAIRIKACRLKSQVLREKWANPISEQLKKGSTAGTLLLKELPSHASSQPFHGNFLIWG